MTSVSGSRPWTERWIFFNWWYVLNGRLGSWPAPRRWLLLSVAALVGLVGRLWAATAPPNFDFWSFIAVSDAILHGDNPYATGRHNYGPIWFILHSTVRRFLEDPVAFRVGLTFVLAMADAVIAYLLMHRGYLAGACLFLVAPITIAISGQHQQFDNVAVALALGAALFVTRGDGSVPIGSRDWGAVLLLGLSLSTKHDFLLLPLWFAFMQAGWLRRMFYALVPLCLFGLSLLPYWIVDSTLVREYVLSYRSNTNAPAFYLLMPDELVWGWINRGYVIFIFLAVLVVLGWIYRRVPTFEATLLYAISLVVFSTAIVDQYFAIPMAGVAVFLNIGFLAWIGYVSVYLLGEPEDLNVPIFNSLKLHLAPYQEGTYRDQFLFLFVGWLILNVWLWRRGWINGRPGEIGVVSEEVQPRDGKPSVS